MGDEVTKKIEQEKKENGSMILDEPAKLFAAKNINVNTMLKEGDPAQTIIENASKENFDLVVMGSRGLGGLKKLMLGSVSNAVAQKVGSTAMIVK